MKKIAWRRGEPGLDYATDEDTRGIDPDPLANRFDLGSDPLVYAQSRTKMISDLIPSVINKVTKDGDGYQRSRQAFGVLLGSYGQAVFLASRYVGGIAMNRDHKGDPKERSPFIVVTAEKQREAMKLLEAQVFSDKPFAFPPELYNQLASTRWEHWGMTLPMRPDYAVHEMIAMWQDRVLDQLLSPLTLERLHDSELRVAKDKDAFTTAELFSGLTSAIFTETAKFTPGDYSLNRKPAISSLRRNLQRIYVKRLANVALGYGGAPEDCQTVAYGELVGLWKQIDNLVKSDAKLDTYTRAHLLETHDRIHKVLDSRLTFSRP